jgi:uncharacterized protein (TIGR02466 family)
MIVTEEKYIFPSFMFTSVDTEFTQQNDIIGYCYHMKEQYPGNYNRSNVNGWQSPTFTKNNCKDFFKQNFYNKFWNQFLQTISPIKLSEPTKKQFYLANIWININDPGSYNLTHIHPGGMISGAYYVKVPENSGGIVFENNLAASSLLYSHCNNEFTKTNHKVDPVDGQMILFNAHLPHYVQQNKSDEDRITISFNVIVVEKQAVVKKRSSSIFY